MAGHSQFKNIMHRKGAQDAKKAKIFNKITREITVAAKLGVPDPTMNARLRLAMQNARLNNVPKERVERALKNAQQSNDSQNFDEIRYEGYGPGGVAVIIEALTDNRNRTAAEVRAAFLKYNGNLGETNSVNFMFDQCGVIEYEKSAVDFDLLFEKAIDAGAQDLIDEDGFVEVITTREDFARIKDLLEEAFDEAKAAKILWRPQNSVPVDEETAKSLLKLIDVLEDNDDVQEVYSNFEISDEIMQKLSA